MFQAGELPREGVVSRERVVSVRNCRRSGKCAAGAGVRPAQDGLERLRGRAAVGSLHHVPRKARGPGEGWLVREGQGARLCKSGSETMDLLLQVQVPLRPERGDGSGEGTGSGESAKGSAGPARPSDSA